MLLFCAANVFSSCGLTGGQSDEFPVGSAAAITDDSTWADSETIAEITASAEENTAPVIDTSDDTSEDTEIKADTQAPDTKVSETKVPETKTPETETSETETSETKASDIKASDTKVPEANASDTKAPDTKAPETKAPDTKAPETQTPVSTSETLNETAIFASASITGLKQPSASGTYVKSNDFAVFDYSNCSEGYVMLKYSGQSDKNYVVRIKAPSGVFYDYYMLPASSGIYQTFPLSEGSGSYTVSLYESRGGTKFASVFSEQVNAAIKDDYTAFLYPNYYVNYSGSSKAVKLAKYITSSMTKNLDKISAVYSYVIGNIDYDKELAAAIGKTVTVYVPDLENLMIKKKGICFDYASLMSAMLRSLGIPSKLVIGYTGQTYHAWINVYTAETGWINAMISFDGKTWKLMDPTYASTSDGDSTVMKYINNASNYLAKYTY